MATEPIDGILHTVTNDTPTGNGMYGAQTGALTADFSVWMAIPQHHDRITIMNASIPKTYYLINANAYTFNLRADDGKGTDVEYVFDCTRTAAFGYGNYTSLTWLTALNSASNWLRNGVAGTAPGTWTIGTYSRAYKLTFAGGDYILKSTQGIYGLSAHMARYMGFPHQTAPYNSGYFAGLGLTLVAPRVVNFVLTNVIHICSDVGQEDAPAAKGNCIGRVYVNDTPFGTFASLFNTNPYETSRALRTREQGTKRGSGNAYRLVRFALLDDNGDTIDINGAHVVMGIYTYARASLYELVRRSANVFSEVAQEARQLGAAQLRTLQRVADKPVVPPPDADVLV